MPSATCKQCSRVFVVDPDAAQDERLFCTTTCMLKWDDVGGRVCASCGARAREKYCVNCSIMGDEEDWYEPA